MKELVEIQSKVNAPKNQRNKFGNYNYRSCEDILEVLKPILKDAGCSLTISDDIIMIGNRIYIKAVAELKNASGETVHTTAFAREEETKKGMDASQVTGAASSYARKYALNGLFCIDDNKDSDTTNTHGKDTPEQSAKTDDYHMAFQEIIGAQSLNELTRIYNAYQSLQTNIDFKNALSTRRKEIENAA